MAPQDLHYSLKSLLNCTCISYMAMFLQLSPTQPAFFFFFLFFWLHGCCCFLPSCSSKNFLINSYIWLVCQDFFFFFFAIFNFFYISIITTFLVYPGLLQQPRGLFAFHLSFTLPIHSQLPQLEENGAMREHWDSRMESERFATKILKYGLESNLTNMIDVPTQVPYRKHKITVSFPPFK